VVSSSPGIQLWSSAHLTAADQQNIIGQSLLLTIFDERRNRVIERFDDQLIAFGNRDVVNVRVKVPDEFRMDRDETTASLAQTSG